MKHRNAAIGARERRAVHVALDAEFYERIAAIGAMPGFGSFSAALTLVIRHGLPLAEADVSRTDPYWKESISNVSAYHE